MRPLIPPNTFQAVEARRLGPYSRRVRSMYRYQSRLMANLNASANWIFLPVMSERSNGVPQFLHHDKLFLENNRRCYALRGPNCKPVQTFELPQRRRVGGQAECLLSITLPGMVNPNPPPCELLLILTTSDTLEVRHLHTGEHFKTINLAMKEHPMFHYHSMQHEETKNQVVVYSTKSMTHPVICYMVILDIGREVTKYLRVPFTREVFERSLEKVYLQDGILYTLYRSKKEMRLYDFEGIIHMNHIRHSAESEAILDITALPDPVLVAPNADQQVEIGGFPCTYITNLPGTETYSVRTLDHRELARFEQTDGLSMDSVRFHIDGNGYIANARQDMIKYYTIEATGSNSSNEDTVTSAGRTPSSSEDGPRYVLRPVREVRFDDGQTPTSCPVSHSSSAGTEERSGQSRENQRPASQPAPQQFAEFEDPDSPRQDRVQLGPIELVNFVLAYPAGRPGRDEERRRASARRRRGRRNAFSDADDGVPAGAYPLRRSQRIYHLANVLGAPVYFDEDLEDKRLLFGDDYENELNMLLILGREPGDRQKRGILQMFDDRSGRLVRSMRFDKPLEANVDYTLILDLDVLIIVAHTQNAPVSYTHVYRLVNIDSLSEADRKQVEELGPAHRYSVSFPTPSVNRVFELNFD